jgi:HAE1 family hydrophobic/amphiphilic exporter-1
MRHGLSDISSISVRRPVLAVVANLLLVVAGLAALGGVEVRELPSVDRPVVTIRTGFDGAAAETVDTEVTSLVEGAAARVQGVSSISSESRMGFSRVTVEFDPSVDLAVAASDLRDAVARVENDLPEKPAIIKADSDAQPILDIAVTSPALPIEAISAIVRNEIIDRIAAVEGVADVQEYGNRRQVIRVTVDPVALAARGLTPGDLSEALGDASFDAPAGSLTAGGQDLVVRADARVTGPGGIGDILLDGRTRIRDVAAVTAGPDDEVSEIRRNGDLGLYLGVVRQAQSNTLAISADVAALVEELNRTLPYDIDLAVVSDDAIFIGGAVREVLVSLAIATVIVVAVIFAFFGSWRATLIPAVSVPVALIATVAGIWLMGFSINILTLLALVLATGMVVDDAIVVLENIQRRRAEGLGPRAAAMLGSRQVYFAVLATTATLAAVFIPISFLPGTAGALFAEFGFVLAISIALSSVVALTLCPMLASRVMGRPAGLGPGARLFSATFGRVGRALARLNAWILDLALAAPLVVLAAAVGFAILAAGAFIDLPEELVPPEDRGVISARIATPEGVDLAYTRAQVARVEDVFRTLVETGEAVDILTISGRGSSNSAYFSVRLAPWQERERTQAEIMQSLRPAFDAIPGASISTRSSNSLGIRTRGRAGLTVALTGPTYEAIAEAGDLLVQRINAEGRALSDAELTYDTSQPELAIDIDRDRAADLGIDLSSIAAALRIAIDGREAAELVAGEDRVPVMLQITEGLIDGPGDLASLYVPADDGRVLPLSSVVTLREVASSPELEREGQRRALTLSARLADGASLGSGMAEMGRLAAAVLPPAIGLLFLGEAASLEETSGGMARTLLFAVVIVLLVLAAQFESFLAAVIIMVTVPFGLAAAVIAMTVFGVSLNLYSQIGLVMLVGIMAKNGILLVEFAGQLRDAGRTVEEAIREAAAIRLRPIIMTMVTTVLGGVPLIVSQGPGAEARQALGWIVVGGLGFATLFTLYLTPVAFLLLARFSRPRAAEEARLVRELEEADALQPPAPAQ